MSRLIRTPSFTPPLGTTSQRRIQLYCFRNFSQQPKTKSSENSEVDLSSPEVLRQVARMQSYGWGIAGTAALVMILLYSFTKPTASNSSMAKASPEEETVRSRQNNGKNV
jgi:hypothetical protein